MMILLSLGFLEKVPEEYLCTYDGYPGKEFKCNPDDFCTDPKVLSYHPNMELHDSYINWISHYHLECIDGAHVGMIGSSFFVGWIITLMFLPRMSDTNGRNKFIKIANVIQTLAYALLFMSRNYNVLIVSMTIMGMMSTVRGQIGTIWLYESLQKDAFVLTYTCLLTFEGIVGLGVTLYFMYISKNYVSLLAIGFCMQIVGTLISFTYPESPRWLIKSGQINRA